MKGIYEYEVYACGGIASSDFWLQMHSDITGVPIYTTVENQSAGCLGDAINAAVGAGLYASYPEAAEAMIRIDKEFQPNMDNYDQYKFYMDRYKQTWPAMREIVHATVDHNSKES